MNDIAYKADRALFVRMSPPSSFSWAHAIAQWPAQKPLLFFRMGPRFSVLALEAIEGDSSNLASQPVMPLIPTAPSALPFLSGWMGVLPFGSPQELGRYPARLFQVRSALVWDHETGALYKTGVSNGSHLTSDWPDWLDPNLVLPIQKTNPFTLRVQGTDTEYLEKVRAIQKDIRQGRFYQLNLLRYFEVDDLHDGMELLGRFAQNAGPFASWCRLPDGFEMISFSPERFVGGAVVDSRMRFTTQPIKGTSARHADPGLDKELAQSLQQNPKDRAELAMITDLMRNDLHRVCQPGSVQVLQAFELQSFPHVHHLVATVMGTARPTLTWGQYGAALYPGGSITGAPKVEVMSAIAAYEQRDRGYFMGNFFAWDPQQGRFDSSILIRTVVKTCLENYAFAAGSGIILTSIPEQELAEITTKCAVIAG